MSILNFGKTISLQEFAHAVAECGHLVTLVGEGEMGIGKSAMLKEVAKRLPTHLPAYIDCTLLDLGDFALPYIETYDSDKDRQSNGERVVTSTGLKITRFAPNARFRFHEGKPVIIMLDEIGKAMSSVKNVLMTLMNEGRIGDHFVPEGSRIFATTNLGIENLGDLLQPHQRNRVCAVRIRKSDADEWIEGYALPNNIAPEIIAWVKQFPHCLAAGDDPAQKDNPYINIIGQAKSGAVVTPRSLEKASHIAKRRAVLGDALTISMLTGVIGESAARDLQAFFTVVDKLPTWDAIIASPTTAKLPDDTIARCICVFSAISRVEKDTLSKWMTYVQRMDKEWQALFAKSVMKSDKQSFCVMNREFKDWALTNEWLF
jgi:hypothetical protein